MVGYKYPDREFLIVNNDNGTSLSLGGTNPTNAVIPVNYEEIETVLKRSLDNYGVMTQVSSEYEFIQQGADFLRLAYEARDIEADLDLIEYRFNPTTDVKYTYNISNADFSTYVSNETSVNISFKSSGLNSIIKSKLKEKYDLGTTISINGNEIDDLITKTVALTSRDILLVSELETSDTDSLTESFRMNFGSGNYREGHVGIPLSLNYESDEMVVPQIKDQFEGSLTNGLASMVFYLDNDIQKTIDLSIDLTFTPIYRNVSDLSNDAFFKVILDTYDNGNTLDVVLSKRRVLFEINGDENIVDYFFNQTITTINFNESIVLEPGESLSLQWYGAAQFGNIIDSGRYDVDYKDVSCVVNINEDSERPNSQTIAVLIKDAGDKLMQILTGEKDRYVSDFFTNGDFKLSALTLGLWIRRFYDKNIEISWDQFINNANSLFLTGYTIDIIDGVEKVIHEDISYFFQDFSAIEIPLQVSNVVRSAMPDGAYSSIKMGYKKPSGDNLYEEAQGLDEPNILNSYGTPITRTDTVYDKSSDFRADSYGKEFARREAIDTNPTGDTRYDKTTFVLDLKEGLGEALEERVWQDDFEQEPTGVYSPGTITGLRLSPINTLLRHGKFLRSFLNKFLPEYIRFSNSVGNELLTTQPNGGVERAENSPVLIGDLDNPLFLNQIIEFKSKVTFDINSQVYGRTQVGDRSVPNYFGSVRFINEFGQKEEGYLLELSPNNEGNWKLIKKA